MKLVIMENQNWPLISREEYDVYAIIGEAADIKAIDKSIRRHVECTNIFPTFTELAVYRPGFVCGKWGDRK